ncbi:MAG: hypothetical protein V1744_00595 [Candidatus Altiarchaeota archaeon]
MPQKLTRSGFEGDYTESDGLVNQPGGDPSVVNVLPGLRKELMGQRVYGNPGLMRGYVFKSGDTVRDIGFRIESSKADVPPEVNELLKKPGVLSEVDSLTVEGKVDSKQRPYLIVCASNKSGLTEEKLIRFAELVNGIYDKLQPKQAQK